MNPAIRISQSFSMKTTTKVTIIFLLGMITGVFILSQFAFKENETAADGKHTQHTALNEWHPPALPQQMDFAGEAVPLERREIQEQFDRELIYNFYSAGHMLYLVKLSRRFFPIIEPKLKAAGVPDDFKYLCVAESNLQNLTSRVGAKGYWQFMPTTGPGYNLEINEHVDERYDIDKSTDAACKYLKQAYARFGNWTAAAASYNCGMGGYNSHATFQQTRNYYDLQLPDETNKYIFRILSFKHILSDPAANGFMVSDEEDYDDIPVKKITVNSSISNLAQWALNQGSNYKMLKLLNPWLRSRSLPVRSGKTYVIKLPA